MTVCFGAWGGSWGPQVATCLHVRFALSHPCWGLRRWREVSTASQPKSIIKLRVTEGRKITDSIFFSLIKSVSVLCRPVVLNFGQTTKLWTIFLCSIPAVFQSTPPQCVVRCEQPQTATVVRDKKQVVSFLKTQTVSVHFQYLPFWSGYSSTSLDFCPHCHELEL